VIPSGARVWIALGHTDMRKGMQGLALLVQQGLKRNPHGGVNGTVKFPRSGKLKFPTLRFGFSVGLSGASIFRWASAAPGLDGRRWCNQGVGPDVLGQQIGMPTQTIT
jgi:hypothetical protein